jgi:septal ring factor EnvC (AmiA/AmiB activator)
MVGIDNQITIALIAAVGGIITTWLTVKYKHLVVKKASPARPRDRMDTIFDGYEKLILQQQTEIDRKQDVVAHLENIIENLEQELATTRELLSATKDELGATKRQNTEMKEQLHQMRKDYPPK